MLSKRENTDASSALYFRGDDSLCGQLYRHYSSGILAYLRRHVSIQEDAEDMLLDVFLAALESEPRLAALTEDEQRAWLVTVARNKMIDHHRRIHRRHFLPLEEAKGVLGNEGKTPEEMIVRDEEYELLHLFLQRLPATQQEILQLRFTCGSRCAEIAQILNKREGSVRTMLSRTLNILRTFYEQKDKGTIHDGT